MTRATSVVGCTRSPISALIEPTLAAQPPFISRSAHALGHPALAADDALDAHHLAGQRLVQRHHRVELGRDGAHHLGVDAASSFRSCRSRSCRCRAVRAVVMRRVEAQPDGEVPLPRGAQRRQQAAERPPSLDVPLRAVRLDRARGASLGGLCSATSAYSGEPVLPRRIQGLFLRVRRCRAPPLPPRRQALRSLNREPIDVGAPEQPASADRPHRRQAAVVG